MQSPHIVTKILCKRVCLFKDRQCRFRLLLLPQTTAKKDQEPISFGGKLDLFSSGCTQFGAGGSIFTSLKQRVCSDEMLGKSGGLIALCADRMKSRNGFINLGWPRHVGVDQAWDLKHRNIGLGTLIGWTQGFNSAKRPLRV